MEKSNPDGPVFDDSCDPEKPLRRVLIGLVHNKDEHRLRSARKLVQDLAGELRGSGVCVEIEEASFQIETNQQTKIIDVITEIAYDYAISRTFSLQMRKSKKRARGIARFLVGFARFALRKPDSFRNATRRAVTDKHLHLIQAGLHSGADMVLVLEDDAIIPSNSARKLAPLVAKIKSINVDEVLHLNLGGDSEDGLMPFLRAAGERDEHGFVEVKPPQVDTACAYLLTRACATGLFAQIQGNPLLRLVLIDHLFNLVLPRLGARSQHAHPHVITHGSKSDQFRSWRN